MCGIVGVCSNSTINPERVATMRDRLVHRGPDHAGLWLAEDARVCLGHRRLAIIDLTPEANQPFVSHDGRFVITYNGEIYNFLALRAELESCGVRFRTRSDTEVLVEAYRSWGEAGLERLSGMFAFAIWDTRDRRLFCARDRAGEKPFYYTFSNGAFLFASELKALVAWPEFRKEIHYPALVDFLSLGYIPDPKAIWEGCHKLPPGHRLSVVLPPAGSPRLEGPAAYWDMDFQPDRSVVDWGPAIRATLEHAAKEMAFADVPVGAFLSGGVDSSSVTCALRRSGFPVHTFTVGFEEQDYDERPWARLVAESCKTQHTEKLVQAEDVVPVLQRLIWHYDEPFNDYSYLPTFYLCREARQSITVALSGDGGDELFAGYRKYQRLATRQKVERLMPRPVVQLLTTGSAALMPRASRFGRKLTYYGMDMPALLSDTLTTGFAPSALRACARGPLAKALKDYAPRDLIQSLLRRHPPEKVGLIDAMRYLDFKLTLGSGILVKVDRASMAVSLEVRPVYLHRSMLELAGRLPAHLLADRRNTKIALKDAFRGWLPDALLDRKKMGFALPLGRWMHGELRQLFTEKSSGGPIAELLDCTALQDRARGHSASLGDSTLANHSLFFLKNWLAKWI
jgi:asparagine synthase (glutamine-hydrolysing)